MNNSTIVAMVAQRYNIYKGKQNCGACFFDSQFIDLNQRKNRMHGCLRHSLRQGEAIGPD